ncbi:MAG: helix-turn-helix domain-containing protein [Candidatus Omnitrophica bacterium]|nr:helix-turn-helix domain-containing protein [Candidatus Omnitrophota bacterium]MCG2705945.1 helix-turn-helix domain-containing protein [Candidatus Omnitrophota bacterium]
MPEGKLLTIKEVSVILGISEDEVVKLTESGRIPAYKVGGLYLRFRAEQIEELRRSFKPVADKAPSLKKPPVTSSPGPRVGLKDMISDFLYFNDFYILAFLIIILVLFIIFQG